MEWELTPELISGQGAQPVCPDPLCILVFPQLVAIKSLSVSSLGTVLSPWHITRAYHGDRCHAIIISENFYTVCLNGKFQSYFQNCTGLCWNGIEFNSFI